MTTGKADRIVVIGASAAGLRAAARARRLNPAARVRVIDRERLISYGACGMPYFVSGDIERVDKLRETAYGLLRDPAFFKATKDVEVLTETEAERIDREAKVVHAKDSRSGRAVSLPYDQLVLATGATPITLAGAPPAGRRILTFKRLEEAVSLRRSLEKGEIGKAAIIGGGFIGCELAEAFGSLWGAEVVLVEAAPSVLPAMLDPEMGRVVEAYLREQGVDVRCGAGAEGLAETESGVTLKAGGETIEADVAIMAVGVRPHSRLARECGLAVGPTGGILVDEHLRTGDPSIFAAGDCVELVHGVSGKPVCLPLGSLANRQGRVVGCNLAGGDERFGPPVGSAAVKVFEWNVAVTGLSERAAREAGLDAACAWGTFMDRADYYPEAKNIHLKLVFEKGSQRLLGLQAFGEGEVVKRVDVFAALLKGEGTLTDLRDAEFAYAPPYAPAVDPLFALACAAQNATEEGIEAISPGAGLDGRAILDVREEEEVQAAPFREGALNIPFEQVRERFAEVPGDRPVLVVCAKGVRASETVRMLKENGLAGAVYLGGGTFMWK